jgi:hypothetical protein
MLLAFPGNVRLELEWLTVTNTLAYFNRQLITVVKRFILQALGIDLIMKFRSKYALVFVT